MQLLRVYDHEVCFILLLIFHSDKQTLGLTLYTPIQVCTITNISVNLTILHRIQFKKIDSQAIEKTTSRGFTKSIK